MKRVLFVLCAASTISALAGGLNEIELRENALSAGRAIIPGNKLIKMSLDRPEALYRCGETAEFTVAMNDGAGRPKTSGEIEWRLDNYGEELVAKGTVDLADANPFKIKGTLPYPGFLRLTVVPKGEWRKTYYSAAFEPERIRPAVPKPTDFDRFWDESIARLDRDVSPDVQIEAVPGFPAKGINLQRVSFATVGGRRVHAVLSSPTDMSRGPYPLRIHFPGAGPGFQINQCRGDAGSILLSINSHYYRVPQDETEQNAAYAEEEEAWRKIHGPSQARAYPVGGLTQSRESAHFYGIILGANRAVNWAVRLPGVDCRRVLYTGASQGGAFGLILSGLNKNITRVYAGVPAMADLLGCRAHGRQSGWPRILENESQKDPARLAKIAEVAPYFDSAYFAERIRVPIRLSVGYADESCAPHSVCAAFNAIPSKDKRLYHGIGGAHGSPNAPVGEVNAWINQVPSVSEDELDALVAQMTIREKLGQLKQATLYTREDVEKFLPLVRRGEVGSFIFNETLKKEWRDELQRAALQSRLRVPLSFADNIIHGWWTNFPIPLALACSFESELFEKMAHYGAIEGRQAGLDWTFGPMCDTARDPRWGRVSEGTGEDPWLNGIYAAAQVRGFQGDDASKEDRVAACLKHYCGYSSSTGGRDYNDSDFGSWTLRNLHLPPFYAAIQAGALSLMSGFNTYDGIPVLANREIMSDILRKEWGFDRLVVTDYKSVAQTMTWGVAADEAEAARRCLEVGNDIEMVSTTYDSLEAEVENGKFDVALIDRSVKRVLEFKRAVGLFDRPMSVPMPTGEALRRQTEKMQAFAKECAVKSVVLLKNDGVLPIKPEVRRIALIGPLSTDRRTMIGCWPGMESNDPQTLESFADALKRELGAVVELKVVPGCSINVKPAMIKGDDGVPMLNRSAPPPDADFDADAAIAAAKSCDLVVFALGEARDWTGENASRALLTLTGRQQELFDAVTAAVPNKPVVTVVSCGRPLALPTVSERSSALFYAFHGGDGGPAALAELLTGKASPSGRLTISVPFDVSQVPVYYNCYTTGRPTYGHYLDTPERGALYPFGFGLTYSKFEYSTPSTVGRTVKATVKNVGGRTATETVQLYVRQCACAEGARPKRELRGFRRVTLEPGQSEEVTFDVTPEVLGYVDRKGVRRCDFGQYDLWIASDSVSGEKTTFVWPCGGTRP